MIDCLLKNRKSIKVWVFFWNAGRKKSAFSWNAGENQERSSGQEVTLGVYLRSFTFGCLLVKQSSLVDKNH